MTESLKLSDYASVDLDAELWAEGGYGIVFAGPCRRHGGQWLVLKMLRDDVFEDEPEAYDRFVREALVWVGLWPHVNLIQAEAVVSIKGVPFLVLEYADEGNLRQNLRPDVPFSQRYTWAQMIAVGVNILHTPDPTFLRDGPVVHRDLKPENVLICTGIAKITDFGLAKIADAMHPISLNPRVSKAQLDGLRPAVGGAFVTQGGATLGTCAYRAPEQAEEPASAGPAADVYAFGLILSELLVGRHALVDIPNAYTDADWCKAHRELVPRPLEAAARVLGMHGPLSIPKSLSELYHGCLEKDANSRPTAREIVEELERSADTLGIMTYTAPEIVRTPERQMERLTNWANCYSKFGFSAEALQRLDKALTFGSGPLVLESRASVLSDLGRLNDALPAFAQALQAYDPSDARRKVTLNQQGLTLKLLGRFEEAETSFASAAAIDPSAGDIWCNRALNLQDQAERESMAGNTVQALEYLESACSYIEEACIIDWENPIYSRALESMWANLQFQKAKAQQ